MLNCAQGNRLKMVSTDQKFYDDSDIRFKGLDLDDSCVEDIGKFFDESVKFIDEAIDSGGKVLVHCLAGISRSATIAIAYIMLRHNQSVEEAVEEVRKNRIIHPNEGFLKQLVQLDFKIQESKSICRN